MKKPPKCASLRGIGGVLLLVILLSKKNTSFALLKTCKSNVGISKILSFFPTLCVS